MEDDVVGRLAPFLRVHPELQQICRFGAQWASPHGPEEAGWAPFHIVTGGSCALDAGERHGIALQTGDVAVLPHGGPHTIRAASGSNGPPLSATIRERRPDGIVVKATDAHPDTTLVCGRFRFEQASGNMVLAALPPVIVLAASAGDDAAAARIMVELIRLQLDNDRLGAAAIAGGLASAIAVLVLRTHLEHAGGEEVGTLALLGKRQTARALACMLADPARHWTLDELAEHAMTSRATLVRLFRAACGRAPLAFLAHLRLSLARNRLRAGSQPIAAIAGDVGYESETAFSRAYARHFAIAPGADRKHQAAGA
jgi:AraC family transcriptional activator of mtrCDE